MKKNCGQKVGNKSCQSNFDTRASDFGSFLVILLHTNIMQGIFKAKVK